MDAAALQNLLMLVAMVLIPVGVGGGGFMLLREARQRARRRVRLTQDHPSAARPQAGKGASDMLTGVVAGVRRVGDRLAIQDPNQVSLLRNQLIRAGYFNREAVALYLGARVTALGLATACTVLVLPFASAKGGGFLVFAVACMMAVAALIGPERVIKARIADREREYREGFPDLLDLLVASVEAGLSLDAAVSRITDELVRRYPRLAEHLKLLSLELRAGRSRREVWQRLAERLGIDEAGSFATMLRQAEEMGTSLGDTLKVFSDEMRSKRMLKAEEKALALPAKMTVPLVIFIFPCLLGVLILPAAVKVARAFGHG
jgi:tight adherence protein C